MNSLSSFLIARHITKKKQLGQSKDDYEFVVAESKRKIMIVVLVRVVKSKASYCSI